MSAPSEPVPGGLAQRLRVAVGAAGALPAQWEASVRCEAGRIATGERVMIERASEAVCRAVFEALEVPLPAEAQAMFQLAGRTGTPLIAGWDRSRVVTVAKLYLNASDRSAEVRAELAAALGWSGLEGLAPPHLLAINATHADVLRKSYHQGATLEGVPGASSAIRVPPSLFAGAVVSHELPRSGPPVVRATFAAIRDAMDGEVERWLSTLQGWDPSAIDAALPFRRGHCRSIGWNAAGDWVAYFKPAGAGVPLEQLEPVAIFVAAGHDVAVFVEEKRPGRRAFATTERFAVSFRGGETAPRTLTAPLHAWVVARVRHAEASGRAPAELLSDPPPPWRAEARRPRDRA